MKKNFLLSVIGFLFSLATFCQTSGNYVSATIIPGSASNSVYIAFMSNTTLTNSKFSTFQFAIALPSTIIPFTGTSITSLDPAISYFPVEVSTDLGGSTSFTVYGFSGDGSQAGSGITYNAGVEYNIAEVFFTGGGANAISNLRIIQIPNGGIANGNDNFYVADRGFDVTNAPAQFYSRSPANVSNDGNGFSGYSYAIISSGVLPVKLTNFSAIKKNNDAVLNWQVSNQDANSSYFELQRSFNGTDFKKVGRVDVNLSTGLAGSYAFTDVNAAASRSNVLYYRLKMVDKDEKVTYSGIKNIRLTSKAFGVSVYPNPARQFSTVNIDLENESSIILSLTDATGQLIQKSQFNGFKGLNQKQVDLSKLASGSYVLKVNAGNEIQILSIIKE
ncbi:MAG: T9SS type A sorting domain-containing protein [Bacteroidota bacterium]|nr:T9SS type A sorting domain-containing protein [Bacteroidota bacterium]